MAARDYTGLYRHGAGWRAVVSAGRGRPPKMRHFPKGTDVRVMQAWRDDERARLRLQRKARATSGTFEYDAQKYLDTVTALSSYAERVADIARWKVIFGTRQRDMITSREIREVRDRWMTEPRGLAPDGKTPLPPYAASTINHRLRALSNLWTVLDGRRAPNPVREVPEAPEPDALPRALSYDLIERIIAAVTDRSRPIKGQGNKDTVSLTKVRLRVMAYTGLTYSQLARLTPASVDLQAGSMLVGRRRKGKGAKPRRLPLLPAAIDAFRALAAAQAWGPFSGDSVRKTFLLAVGKVRTQLAREGLELAPIRPNDLRHSMGSLVYRATGSREAARDLLQHESVRTTERYTLAAVSDVLNAQMALVRQIGTTSSGDKQNHSEIRGDSASPSAAESARHEAADHRKP
jgi:integrase